MGWLSSLFNPNIRTIQDAERVTFRWFYVGFLAIGIGLVLTLTLLLTPIGITVMGMGGAIVLLTIIWLWLASKRSTVTKNCPRCGKRNSIFREEPYFKCVSCGYFAILHEI